MSKCMIIECRERKGMFRQMVRLPLMFRRMLKKMEKENLLQ